MEWGQVEFVPRGGISDGTGDSLDGVDMASNRCAPSEGVLTWVGFISTRDILRSCLGESERREGGKMEGGREERGRRKGGERKGGGRRKEERREE